MQYEIKAHFKLRNPIIKQFKQSQTIASITLTKASSVDFQGFKQNRARKLNISGTRLAHKLPLKSVNIPCATNEINKPNYSSYGLLSAGIRLLQCGHKLPHVTKSWNKGFQEPLFKTPNWISFRNPTFFNFLKISKYFSSFETVLPSICDYESSFLHISFFKVYLSF